MKRKEVLLGVDGDALALEILLDGSLTDEERQLKLAEAAKKFTAAVERKISGRGRR